jgi:hypothetical protein
MHPSPIASAQALAERVDELSLAMQEGSPSALGGPGVAWAELVQARDREIAELSVANRALAGEHPAPHAPRGGGEGSAG